MFTKIKAINIATILSFSLIVSAANRLPQLEQSFAQSSVSSSDRLLTVSTGKVERVWQLTRTGLKTTSFTGIDNPVDDKSITCDWEYFGLIDNSTPCRLISLQANKGNDEGFTSDHLEIIAEFEYPTIEMFVKYQIWAYPNAPGIYTRVWFKGASKSLKLSKSDQEEISFKMVSGNDKYNYNAHGISTVFDAKYTMDKSKVEYLISGLSPRKEYVVCFKWWDFEGVGKKLNASVSSVDGEKVELVVPTKKLPDYANKKEMPEVVSFKLPSKVLLDGSFRLYINKVEGDYAAISEIWIYEKNAKTSTIVCDKDRFEELVSASPTGFELVGYADCGNKSQINRKKATARVDYLPISSDDVVRTYSGYNNDTQHRNTVSTPLIEQQVKAEAIGEEEIIDWASIAIFQKDKKNTIIVKESHKCVNQYGHDTGAFVLSQRGGENTGAGIMPSEILPDRYRGAWASWAINCSGNEIERELAIKQFDRIRYPIDPSRDIYIQANTWGSGRDRKAADEESVLVEIESQKDLGIDIQQIDDGWQNDKWYPSNADYPNGWLNVVKAAKDAEIKLGLWGAAMKIPLEALKWNYDNGHFVSYKLDFANISNYNGLETTITKIRDFVQYTNHNVRVNWDVTENAPRFGYFWAREYGCVYLENRKPVSPANVVYIPHLVLRDIWELAKYCNVNKFQTTIQNIDMVNKEVSDAYLHNHPYCTMIGLTGTPLFFQETHFYSEQARAEIKPIIQAYKAVRDEMYDCYVLPIGQRPDNKSWTGFQAYTPDKNEGFLTIFRELENKQKQKTIGLNFLQGKTIYTQNLITGELDEVFCDEDGGYSFEIDRQAGFIFLKYNAR